MSEDTRRFDLAIIMPVRNEERFLAQTLDQVYLQDFPMERLEVVLSEGGSTDRTREIAESYKDRFGSLKVLDNPRRLPSSGRNVGVKNSTAPYIMVLDGHTYIPSRTLLRDVVAGFEEKRADCLCRPQPLTPPDLNEFETAVAVCRGSSLGHKPGSEIYADFEGWVDPTSSGACWKRTVFDRIGYFDEQFDASEDVEFNFRVHQAGFKSWLSPKYTVFYYPRSTLHGLWRQMGRYGLGRFRFAQKHQLFSPMQWFAAVAVAGLAALALFSLISSAAGDLLRTLVALYLLIVIGFSAWLAFREKRLGCLLFGVLIFPTIHFGLGVGFLRGVYQTFRGRALKADNQPDQ